LKPSILRSAERRKIAVTKVVGLHRWNFCMNLGAIARRVARFGYAFMLPSLVAGIGVAHAQTGDPIGAPATLDAIDFNFVGQANLGAPFQVDSGRLAERNGESAAIRDYAHLMVTSHVPVVR
jgi:putative membrane protein